jgi:NADH-quinone oxidoreductase subunit L
MFRLVFIVFFGKPRYDEAHVHPHESKWPMALPLVLLAIPSVVIGFVGFPPEKGVFHDFLEPVFYPEVEAEAQASTALYTLADDPVAGEEHATEHAGPHEVSMGMTLTFGAISTIVAVSGILVAYLTYITGAISAAAVTARFPAVYRFLYNKWYIDEVYSAFIVQPMRRFAYFLWRIIDVGIIDGAVNGVASTIGYLSSRLRLVQTGLVANYALAIALGMVIFVGVYLAGFSNLFR